MRFSQLIVSILNSMLPVMPKTVMFKSFSGQYSDSPKVLSEYIHDQYPEIHIVWIKSSENNDSFPEYAEVIEKDSAAYHKYEWRATAIVDNVSSIRSSWIYEDDNFIKKVVLRYYTRKKNRQLSISTWHGVPLKRIGMDSITSRRDCYLSTNCNYVLAGNKHSKRCLESALGNAVPVIMSGIPRNDGLVNCIDRIGDLKEKLGIPKEKKVIMYAPTFRQDVTISGVMQMKTFDFKRLFELLHNRFGGKWCFVFRTHMHVTSEIKKTRLFDNFEDLIIDGNIHDDMADYLKCADVLLTDYSSCMFDFIFTERPCFLYTPDLADYENKERGFYLDFSKLPFDSSSSLQGLYDCIERFDFNVYRDKCKNFLAFLENVDDGKATERVAEEIIDIINRKKSIKSFMKDFR